MWCCITARHNWRRGLFKLHANLLKLNTTIPIGKIETFDEANEECGTYCERVEQYFLANEIEEDKEVPAILSLMGSKTYGLLRSLC
jgi:hypothetical protein